MTKRLSVAIAALLALAGVAGAAGPKHRPAPPVPGCVGIELHSTPASRTHGRLPAFSATRILDVNAEVVFAGSRRFGRLEAVEVRYFTPNNHLYSSTIVSIAAEGSNERHRRVPGWRHPLKVSHARSHRGRGVRLVETPPLLVAGTDIMTSSLYGVWRVEAIPAGAQRGCSADFRLQP